MTRDSKINLYNLNYHNKSIRSGLIYNISYMKDVFTTLEEAGDSTTEDRRLLQITDRISNEMFSTITMSRIVAIPSLSGYFKSVSIHIVTISGHLKLNITYSNDYGRGWRHSIVKFNSSGVLKNRRWNRLNIPSSNLISGKPSNVHILIL